LNILFIKSLDTRGITHSELKPSVAPFHRVITGALTMLVGQITLLVTFRSPGNYRTEYM
jgi:hypothetical protein